MRVDSSTPMSSFRPVSRARPREGRAGCGLSRAPLSTAGAGAWGRVGVPTWLRRLVVGLREPVCERDEILGDVAWDRVDELRNAGVLAVDLRPLLRLAQRVDALDADAGAAREGDAPH